MNNALRTTAYFLIWGTVYGFLLGAWSGTAIFPVFGTAFATGWGTGIGAACGFLVGLLVAVVQAYAFHPDVDLGRFRRRLTLGIGLLVPVAASILLIATSEGTLWDYGIVRHPAFAAGFLPFCLLAVTIWGSLSAAYVANAYPDWLVQLKTGQRLPLIDLSFRYPVARTTWMLARQGLSWWLVALGAIAGIILHARTFSSYNFDIMRFIEGGAAGAVASVVLMLLISFGNAALLNFLRKTIFAEDVLSVSPAKQRWVFTGIAFVFTGLTSVWTLIFVPLCAFLMALYVYRAFPLLDEDTDKAKRKEKNTLALEEGEEAMEMIEAALPYTASRLTTDEGLRS